MGLRQSVPIEKSDNNEINEVEQINESDGNINAKSLPINEINSNEIKSNEIKSNYSQEESENNYEINLAVAGFTINDIEIILSNDVLIITGNKTNKENVDIVPSTKGKIN